MKKQGQPREQKEPQKNTKSLDKNPVIEGTADIVHWLDEEPERSFTAMEVPSFPHKQVISLEDRFMTLFSHVLFTEEENPKKQGRSSGKEGPTWSTWI